jgi:hypothetical protein
MGFVAVCCLVFTGSWGFPELEAPGVGFIGVNGFAGVVLTGVGLFGGFGFRG